MWERGPDTQNLQRVVVFACEEGARANAGGRPISLHSAPLARGRAAGVIGDFLNQRARMLSIQVSMEGFLQADVQSRQELRRRQQSPGRQEHTGMNAPERKVQSDTLFEPDRNCWRVERAERVALLVDADNYFSAFAKAALRATRSIIILAWDF